MREVGKDSIFCFYSRAEQGRVKKLHALCQKNGMVWLAEPIKTLPCLARPMTGSIPGTHRKLERENSTALSSDITSGTMTTKREKQNQTNNAPQL